MHSDSLENHTFDGIAAGEPHRVNALQGAQSASDGFVPSEILQTRSSESSAGFCIGAEASMDNLSEAEQAALSQWTSVAFDAAVLAGYIIPPWRPSLEAYEAFYELFIFGFDPAQAAEAMFATRQ